ncbi:hypothetical protein FI667_g16909, partial [Globisporangium splendens]
MKTSAANTEWRKQWRANSSRQQVTIPTDATFAEAERAFQDEDRTAAERKAAALRGVPTPVNSDQCYPMWIPARDLTSTFSDTEIMTSLGGDQKSTLWANSIVHLRDFKVIRGKGVSFTCTDREICTKLGNLQLTVCGRSFKTQPTKLRMPIGNVFPRLNGTTFLIWKAHVTTSLKGKGLYGFIEKRNYESDTESNSSDWGDLDPVASMDVDMEDLAPPPSKSGANSSESDDSDNESSAEDSVPPKIISFAARKREEEEKRAMKAKVKNRKPSARKLRKMEARTRAFVFKTIDDMHVLIVDDQPTAYDVFQTLCHRYQGTKAHGDPYWIQHYLMEIRFGTPESRETREEKGLATIGQSNATPSSSLCGYCERAGHETRECKTLGRHLLAGAAKPGTVITEIFKVTPPQMKPQKKAQKKRFQPSNAFNAAALAANTVYDKNGFPLDPNVLLQISQQVQAAALAKCVDDGICFQTRKADYGIIAVTDKLSREMELAAKAPSEVDPVWIIDSGSISHAVYQANWFTSMKPGVGSITVGGNHKIPIKGISKFDIEVKDKKGVVKTITLDNVLYAPDLKFNLFSVPQVTDDRSRSPSKSLASATSGTRTPSHSLPQRRLLRTCTDSRPTSRSKNSPMWLPQCILTFIDYATRFLFIYVIKRKSDLYDCFEDFRKKALNIFRKDVGTVEYCENQFSPEIQRFQADNARESSPNTDNVSPYQLWYGSPPSAEYLKVFGCTEYVHIPEPHRNKLDARAKKCMFVGLPTHKKGYHLLDVSIGTIVYSRDVQFDEADYPSLEFLHHSTQNRAATIQPFNTRPTFEPCGAEHLLPPLREALSLHKDSQVRMTCKRKLDDSNPSNAIAITDRATENDNSTQTVHKDLYEIHSFLSIHHEDEPKSYKQAMASPEAIHWRLAAESEYSSLTENKTWTLVTLPPIEKH